MVGHAGYWLNPKNDKLERVDTHDNWIRNKENAKAIGLSDDAYGEIMSYPDDRIDEIRAAACMAGLVRIRCSGNMISCQFWQERNHVPDTLWAIILALKELKIHPETNLMVGNLRWNDEVRITLQDLQTKLENSEVVLREGEEEGEVYDIPTHHPAIRIARLMKGTCTCGNPQWGFDCVCAWVLSHPGNTDYSCEYCGLYKAGAPRCNRCQAN